jgi:hypothetical protein
MVEAAWDEVRTRSNYFSRAMVLEMCVRLSLDVPGSIIEFGVASGTTLRSIIATLERYGPAASPKKIFGVDSFQGLREPFENAPAGAFACEPPDLPGVDLVVGYFEDVCTDALRERVGRVAFAHLDADLYSSTLCALRWLTPLLGTGSLLLFDEFTGGERSEARAFEEWRAEIHLPIIRVAEFDRGPSGWGSVIDRRLLFQVVGPEALPPGLPRL